MRLLLLNDHELDNTRFSEYLHSKDEPHRLSESCHSLQDCIRWLEENFDKVPGQAGMRNKSRLVVKRGKEYQTLKIQDIVYFFSDQKVIFVVDREEWKYMVEKTTLTRLQDVLDPNMFYRVNRKYIINADYLKSFKPITKSRIKVDMILPVSEEIIVSQEQAADFRRWVGEN